MFSVILYMLRQTLRRRDSPLLFPAFSPLTVTFLKLAVILRPLYTIALVASLFCLYVASFSQPPSPHYLHCPYELGNPPGLPQWTKRTQGFRLPGFLLNPGLLPRHLSQRDSFLQRFSALRLLYFGAMPSRLVACSFALTGPCPRLA
jgi:hypothetical protein